MTRLSVAVPAYNQGDYLGATLDSLLDQAVAPHEILVSDNHSTDATAAVLEAYADRVRVVRPPQHLSVLEHWDWMVGQVDGDWFAIMSSDDLAHRSYVEVLAAAAAEPGATVAHAGFEVIDGEGRRTATSVSLRTRAVRRAPETLREQLVGPLVNLSASAARCSTWADEGGFANGCDYLGDWTFWIRAAARGPFVYSPRIISSYRVYDRPETLRHRAIPSTRDLVHVYGTLLPAVAPGAGVPMEEVREACRQRVRRHLGAASSLLDDEERAEVAAVLRPLAADAGLDAMLDEFERSGLPAVPYFRYARTRRIAGPLLERVRSMRAGSRR